MPIIYFLLFLFFGTHHTYPIYTVMINPAGDAQHPGRQIDDFFERGLTFQYAQQLKNNIEQTLPEVRIVISRFPGETVDPLQSANFANRLNVDLCLAIHFFQEQGIKPTLFIYYLVWNPITDFWKRSEQDLCFIPYDQIHKLNLETTKRWATLIYDSFCEPPWNNLFDKKGIFAFPFQPLKGFSMPALALEVGLPAKSTIDLLIKPLIQSIKKIFAL